MKVLSPAAVLLAILPAIARSAPPRLAELDPPAIQRDVESKVRVFGKELGSEAELILPFEANVRLDGGSKEGINVTIKPSSATLPGVYPVRVRTAEGISNLRLLVITDLPVIRVQQPNGQYTNGSLDLTTAQTIQPPCLIVGDRLERDIEAFRFAAKAGDRLTLVSETWRVGLTPDPILRLRNHRGRMLAYAHDTPTLQRDERLDVTAKEAGDHYLEMQSTGGGGWNNYYLVRVGALDYARTVFPLGGRRGDKVRFQVVNRDGQTSSIESSIPDDPWSDHWRLPLPEHPGSLPWPLACGDYPELM
jgi:hypothetical protein